MPGGAHYCDSSWQPTPYLLDSGRTFIFAFIPSFCSSLTSSPLTFEINLWHCFWLVSSNSLGQEGPGALLSGEPFLKKLLDSGKNPLAVVTSPLTTQLS